MLLNVYAFGSALMDIQVAVQDQVIDELQLQKGHMYLTERTRQGEVLNKLFGGNIEDLSSLGGNVHLAAGGSAANTVYGIMQLGGKATLCGKVARDIFGSLAKELPGLALCSSPQMPSEQCSPASGYQAK